jgi:hypothetical protein
LDLISGGRFEGRDHAIAAMDQPKPLLDDNSWPALWCQCARYARSPERVVDQVNYTFRVEGSFMGHPRSPFWT